MPNDTLIPRLAGLLLVLHAPAALSHGIDSVVEQLALTAIIVGLAGGLIVGVLAAHPGHGLLSTFAVLIFLVLGYLVYEMSVAGTFALDDVLLPAIILTTFAGAVPLAVAFFLAFALAAPLRARLGGQARGPSDDTETRPLA